MQLLLSRVPSFWGVAALLMLLVSLPWLGVEEEVARPIVSRPEAALGPPRPPRDERFTFYIFADEGPARQLQATADPIRAAILLVRTPEEQDRLDIFVNDVNTARMLMGIASVTVIDLR